MGVISSPLQYNRLSCGCGWMRCRFWTVKNSKNCKFNSRLNVFVTRPANNVRPAPCQCVTELEYVMEGTVWTYCCFLSEHPGDRKKKFTPQTSGLTVHHLPHPCSGFLCLQRPGKNQLPMHTLCYRSFFMWSASVFKTVCVVDCSGLFQQMVSRLHTTVWALPERPFSLL